MKIMNKSMIKITDDKPGKLISLILICTFLSVAAISIVYFAVSLKLANHYAGELINNIKISEEYYSELNNIRYEILKLNEEKTVRDIIDFFKNLDNYIDNFKGSSSDILISDSADIRKIKSISQVIDDMELLDKQTERIRDGIANLEYVPEPVINYYNMLIVYLNNDISRYGLILNYYESGNFSNFDSTEIDKLEEENKILLMEINAEKERILKEYKIDFKI